MHETEAETQTLAGASYIGISLDQVPVVRAVPNTTPIRQRPRPVSSQIKI